MSNQILITFDTDEQAERYFKRFNGINGANRIEHGNKEIEKLQKENSRLKECVEFYANKYSWYLHKDKLCEVRRSIEYDDTESFGVLTETGENFLEVLGGKRARECLAKLEEK